MATKKNMAVVIATIKSIYPYYAKDGDVGLLARNWLLLLQEYDDNIINNALLLCLKECETPPTPAHIIKKIEAMQPKPTNGELWAVFVKNLRKMDDLQQKFYFTATDDNGVSQGEKAVMECREIYKNMPEVLKKYVGSYGEMLRIAREMDDKSLSFEKNKFLKEIPEIKKDHELQLIANPSLNLLEGE